MVIQTMGNYLSIQAWTSQFFLTSVCHYVPCSKVIHIYFTDTLASRDENTTEQQSLPILLTQLFPSYDDKLLQKQKDERQKGGKEKCITQPDLQVTNYSNHTQSPQNKKKNKPTPKKKPQTNPPNISPVPQNSYIGGGEEAINFYVSHFS